MSPAPTPPSDTPRADASLAKMKLSGYGGLIELSVGRDLERELAAAKSLAEQHGKDCHTAQIEAREAKKQAERLAGALKELRSWCNDAEYPFLLCTYRKEQRLLLASGRCIACAIEAAEKELAAWEASK